MKLKFSRTVALAAAALLTMGGLVAGATAADAATGTLVLPATGTGASLFNVQTSAACSAGATNFRASISSTTVTGWTNIVLVGNTSLAAIGDLVNAGAPISNSLDAIAINNGIKFDPGTYTVLGICQNNLGTTQFDTFTASIVVTGTAGAVGNTFTTQVAAAPASSTVLAVTPASPVNLGANVTFTATVTSTAPVAGAVNFFDGATQLNATPVAVTAAGTATFATTALTGGAGKQLTAQFVPTNPATIAPSTSAPVTFTVNAPATATTTTLSSSPAAPTTATPIVLTATVAPAAAVGTVAFLEGATNVGAGTVTGGVATVTLTGVSAAAHTYTATFTPTNPANFIASTSTAITVTVTAFAGYNLNGVVGGGENITTSIGGGTLTLTAATTAVDLGPATLNAANTLFVTAPKDINPVTVSDTRAGSLGYTVSGIAGDFTSTSVATNKINSENLGWTPKIVGTAPATITAGAAVPPANGVAVGAVSTPVQGLKAQRTLGSAAAGGSIGTVQFSATLALQAPLTTAAGSYATTLVITAI